MICYDSAARIDNPNAFINHNITRRDSPLIAFFLANPSRGKKLEKKRKGMRYQRNDNVHEGNAAFCSHRVGMLILGVARPGCCLCATSMERSICVISRVGEIPRISLIFFFPPLNERERSLSIPQQRKARASCSRFSDSNLAHTLEILTVRRGNRRPLKAALII